MVPRLQEVPHPQVQLPHSSRRTQSRASDTLGKTSKRQPGSLRSRLRKEKTHRQSHLRPTTSFQNSSRRSTRAGKRRSRRRENGHEEVKTRGSNSSRSSTKRNLPGLSRTAKTTRSATFRSRRVVRWHFGSATPCSSHVRRRVVLATRRDRDLSETRTRE